MTTAAAAKAAGFLQLCDGFGIPVVSLVDSPGFMVGRREGEAWCAGPRGCSPRAGLGYRWSASCCAAATALVHRRSRAAAYTSRYSRWRGPVRTSADGT